ncbi:nucleoid-associated protein [Flexithrix dorotheae]|uniref:nucleoid-associated protein n=1 Tax=Flexithrix dorotheae TaxID=70993 RepID=UPI00037115F0|nr:nucleoid-associated protein [Flexithrix dorotheae]
MIDFKNTEIEQLAVHYVGNPAQDQPLKLSNEPLRFSDDMVYNLLINYFFKPFKSEEVYQFHHDDDISLNEVFASCYAIFSNQEKFFEQSRIIADILYRSTDHPQVKSGEMFIAYFSGTQLEGEEIDAIGIFKAENKDTILKVFPEENGFGIDHEEGININKLDKGCIVFNLEAETGYKVAIVDNLKTNGEAIYWKKDFLGLLHKENNFTHTQSYLQLCKGFFEEVYNEENGVDKSAQIMKINQSKNYFKDANTFKEEVFEQEVMQEQEIIEAFKDYKESYQETEEFKLPDKDQFQISKQAVKSQQKFFKSILKLDKNFHVYIHGGRDLIERGFDDHKKMKYYKIYFNELLP